MTSEQTMNVSIKKLNQDAIIPKYQTMGASGFDLHSTTDATIMPGETTLISTGLAFSVPLGFELQVRPRSGLSAKTGLRVSNSPGTVDSDYTGEVKIILTNTGSLPYSVRKGDRVAQGVICPIYQANFVEVDEFLFSTGRGESGFGSTGV